MKHVFKSEQEVVELIDRYLAEIVARNAEVLDFEHLIVQLRDTCEAPRIRGIRDDIETMLKSIAWREGRLENLKQILAEMRTLPLPMEIPETHEPTKEEPECPR